MRDSADIQGALKVLGRDDLEDILIELLQDPETGEKERVEDLVLNKAIYGGASWIPERRKHSSQVEEALRFSQCARQVGRAQAEDVERYLWMATRAFFCRDYATSRAIFESLLSPLCDFEIDLGQHEMIDEKLSTDLSACAAQFAVAIYMLEEPDERIEAVWGCIDQLSELWMCGLPLERLVRTAVEPLPDYESFLVRWTDKLMTFVPGEHARSDSSRYRHWLHEAIEQTRGSLGLAELARGSAQPSDFMVWISSLQQAGNLDEAIAACDEAARRVESEYDRARFFDRGAEIASSLKCSGLDEWYGKAWESSPTLLRLCRWLGAAACNQTLIDRIKLASSRVSKQNVREQALVCVLSGDHSRASRLLSRAPGLGWSKQTHPGHVLFPLMFEWLKGGTYCLSRERRSALMATDGEQTEVVDLLGMLIDRVEIQAPTSKKVRDEILAAMQKASIKRLEGIAQNQRRRFYGHASSLVQACALCMEVQDGQDWMKTLRASYRRYSALQREFENADVSKTYREAGRALGRWHS